MGWDAAKKVFGRHPCKKVFNKTEEVVPLMRTPFLSACCRAESAHPCPQPEESGRGAAQDPGAHGCSTDDWQGARGCAGAGGGLPHCCGAQGTALLMRLGHHLRLWMSLVSPGQLAQCCWESTVGHSCGFPNLPDAEIPGNPPAAEQSWLAGIMLVREICLEGKVGGD